MFTSVASSLFPALGINAGYSMPFFNHGVLFLHQGLHQTREEKNSFIIYAYISKTFFAAENK